MTERPRDNDNELIDILPEDPTPGQAGASGGDLAREIGQRDDEPTPPNRGETSDE